MTNEEAIKILKELHDDAYRDVEYFRQRLKYVVARYNSIHVAVLTLEGMIDYNGLENDDISELVTELKSIKHDTAYNDSGYADYHKAHSQIKALEKVIKLLEKNKNSP